MNQEEVSTDLMNPDPDKTYKKVWMKKEDFTKVELDTLEKLHQSYEEQGKPQIFSFTQETRDGVSGFSVCMSWPMYRTIQSFVKRMT